MLGRFDAEHYRLRFAREAGPDVEQGEEVRAGTADGTSPRGRLRECGGHTGSIPPDSRTKQVGGRFRSES